MGEEWFLLYNTVFAEYWRIFWLNGDFGTEASSNLRNFEKLSVPFLPKVDLESKSHKYRTIFKLLEALYTLQHYSDKLGILPKNEELDEVSTSRLAFLAIPYLMGHLLLELPTPDDRLVLLNEAKLYFLEFSTRLSNLSLQFVVNSPAGRADKIALEKHNTEIKKKINHLLKSGSNFDTSLDDVKSPLFPNYADELTIRQLTILLLKKFVMESSTHLQSVDRELEIAKFKAAQTARPILDAANYSGKTEGFLQGNCMKKSLYADCMSERRSAAIRDVFIPGHNLPTMTLAECARLEMEMELNIGSSIGRGGPFGNSVGSETSSDSAGTDSARKWDDWKDNHPWGIGNKNCNIS